MYHINATRILYQTSKYAPVAVLQLDITVSGNIGIMEQISAALDKPGSSNFAHLLSPCDEASAVDMYCDLVLALQRSVGHSVQYCRVEEMDSTDEYRVFVEYEEDTTALYAAELASQLFNGIVEQQDNSQLQQLLEEFEVYARPRALDSNTRLLVSAAKRHDIPVYRSQLPSSLYASTADVQNSLLQLGWGVYQQRCNGTASEGLDSWHAMPQVLDRAQLYPRLINASLPMPVQDLEFLNRNQARRAQRSAGRVGYPVILRPRANRLFQYRFAEDYVFGPLHNDEQVSLAAKHLGEVPGVDVWVESFVAGDQYRFLVMGGEVISILHCRPPVIFGDGIQTIAELTAQPGDADILFRLKMAGLSMNSVLPPGVQLALRGSGSLSNGGSCKNVSMEIPAHFKELAVKVAEQSGLTSLAEIDLIINQLSGHVAAPNCVISNVIVDPDLSMFEQLSDQPERIEDAYLAALFPDGSPSRIPTVSVTGTNGKTTTCRMVARILQSAGFKSGLTCTDGVYLDNKLLRAEDASGITGALDIFMSPDMEAAVLETARGGLANTGIAFDHCDVGACLNIANDHLGKEGIETLDDMAAHKRQVIERTTGTAVLNAEDPRCLAMQDHTAAKEVILVASSTDHPAIKQHIEAGGKAIAVQTGTKSSMVVLLTSANKLTPIMAVNDIPAAIGGAAQYNLMNAMFAIAISLGLGIEKNLIVSTLKAFRMSAENTPGRLNEVTGLPFSAFVDAAHNLPGLEAMVEFSNRFQVPGKKIINFSAPGEWPDDKIKAYAKIAAGNFEWYVVKNRSMDPIETLEYRPSFEEVPELIKKELIHQGVPEDRIIVELDVMDSLDRSIQVAEKGDLLLVLTRISTDEKFQLIKKLAPHRPWVSGTISANEKH